MSVHIRFFEPADYDAVIELWRASEGISLREDVDSREAIARYLERNANLSFVAVEEGAIVGAVLCGTDGRRGYLQHLAVDPNRRGGGIGKALAQHAFDALNAVGIRKCHLMVVQGNTRALAFWRAMGWLERGDIVLMSRGE